MRLAFMPGFDMTPQMRALVERRVLRKVSRYAPRIRSIVVLETSDAYTLALRKEGSVPRGW